MLLQRGSALEICVASRRVGSARKACALAPRSCKPRLAQSAECKALNFMLVGSSPRVSVLFLMDWKRKAIAQKRRSLRVAPRHTNAVHIARWFGGRVVAATAQVRLLVWICSCAFLFAADLARSCSLADGQRNAESCSLCLWLIIPRHDKGHQGHGVKTLWPSSLRRRLTVPFRKGVGPNLTDVAFSGTPALSLPGHVGGNGGSISCTITPLAQLVRAWGC